MKFKLIAVLLLVLGLMLPLVQMVAPQVLGQEAPMSFAMKRRNAMDEGDIMRRPGKKAKKLKLDCTIEVSPLWRGSYTSRILWAPRTMLAHQGVSSLSDWWRRCRGKVKVKKVDPNKPNKPSYDNANYITLNLTNCGGSLTWKVHRSDWERVYLVVNR